ncbi:hypothetical protein QQ008_22415 [Fulvivirgaceae bacterium BMA10]|uniref:Uncharacterized protein n=1 Tax=Splendidivirga corallicola TaxID=3051826 RepID=A0ABT8KVI2_9BACT|nr:hypothetical protein [Fulvivirgaceae bacterium BMA10]
MTKKTIIEKFDQLPKEIVLKLIEEYPCGFADNLIRCEDENGKRISALPFETEEEYYLIRMSTSEAQRNFDDVRVLGPQDMINEENLSFGMDDGFSEFDEDTVDFGEEPFI